MKIIISPAKKMEIDVDELTKQQPIFVERAQELLDVLCKMQFADLQKLWNCNAQIAETNYERIMHMDLTKQLTPAVLAYVGLQYTHMAPRVLDIQAWQYVCDNLRILSGFYGLLRADDGVTPYRLEMQAKLAVGSHKNLYQYWGSGIYDELTCEDKVILNLASKEYSKVIEPFIREDVRMVTCTFGCATDDGYKVKATEAKMARGSMVRWCAEHEVQSPEEVKNFDVYGYQFKQELSDDNHYVFVK